MALTGYLLFFGLLIWDTLKGKQIFQYRHFEPVSTVSVVIPTLNEAENIASCLEPIRKSPVVIEIIVADAGSSDNTRMIAESCGATVIEARKGRGHQICAGISQCHGDAILIVHADCLLREDVPANIIKTLNDRSDCIGGAVAMEYSLCSGFADFMAWLNNARARLTGLYFGDQAQFFRKQALPLIGGFPDMMLMEDVELSMRLKEQGVMCMIPKGIRVSSRRWEKFGVWGNFERVVWFCLSYLIRRRLKIGDESGQDYYRNYYSKT